MSPYVYQRIDLSIDSQACKMKVFFNTPIVEDKHLLQLVVSATKILIYSNINEKNFLKLSLSGIFFCFAMITTVAYPMCVLHTLMAQHYVMLAFN